MASFTKYVFTKLVYGGMFITSYCNSIGGGSFSCYKYSLIKCILAYLLQGHFKLIPCELLHASDSFGADLDCLLYSYT